MQDHQTKPNPALFPFHLEVNATEVHRAIAAQRVPQKTTMFALYRGELVTHAQALDLREADRR